MFLEQMIENEKNITLGNKGSHAVHHKAGGGHFVVVAPPLYEEGVRLRKVLVNMSRCLCAKAYDVVRFDYFGTGFSPGDDMDVSLPQALEDLNQAVAYCKSHEAARITILGVRFGAYLALSNRVSDAGVDQVIAWEPILDAKRYLQELIRGEASSQMFIYGKVKSDQEQLFQQLSAEGRLFIEGYCISSEFAQQLDAAVVVDDELLEAYGGTTRLIYWQSAREHKSWSGKRIDSLWLQGVRIAYNNIRYLDPEPEKLFEATLAGIEKNA